MQSGDVSRTESLIEEMNNIFKQGKWNKETSDFYMEKARQTVTEDKAGSETLLGMISGFNGDFSQMEKYFERALQLSESNPDIILHYGKCLYNIGNFSHAVQILMPLADSLKEASLTMGLACKALGLESRAAYYLEVAGAVPCPDVEIPASPCQDKAMEAVYESFKKEKEIWQSLSTR